MGMPWCIIATKSQGAMSVQQAQTPKKMKEIIKKTRIRRGRNNNNNNL